MSPGKVTAGRPFNVQREGDAAIAVAGRNFFRGSRVRWNGEPLETYNDGGGKELAALVPQRLYREPGRAAITVEQAGGEVSNALPLQVLPAGGVVPVVVYVHPDASPAGRLFSPQPGGFAAISVTGRNYLPGAVLVLGDADLATVFGDVDRLSALVPPALLARPRRFAVRVRNPDGKLSAPAVFTVTP